MMRETKMDTKGSTPSMASSRGSATPRPVSTMSVDERKNVIREGDMIHTVKRASILILASGISMILLGIIEIIVITKLIVAIPAFIIGIFYCVAGGYCLYACKYGESTTIRFGCVFSGIGAVLSVAGICFCMRGVSQSAIYFVACFYSPTENGVCSSNNFGLHYTNIVVCVIMLAVYTITFITCVLHCCIWADVGLRVVHRQVQQYSVSMDSFSDLPPRKREPILSRPKSVHDTEGPVMFDAKSVDPVPVMRNNETASEPSKRSSVTLRPRTSSSGPPDDDQPPPYRPTFSEQHEGYTPRTYPQEKRSSYGPGQGEHNPERHPDPSAYRPRPSRNSGGDYNRTSDPDGSYAPKTYPQIDRSSYAQGHDPAPPNSNRPNSQIYDRRSRPPSTNGNDDNIYDTPMESRIAAQSTDI